MSGGTGDDVLSGGDGSDTLDGGADDDLLIGQWGDDTYVFGVGSGNDTIREFATNVDNYWGNDANGTDQVLFTGLKQADVSFTKANGGNDLVATIIATGETLRITNAFFTGGNGNTNSNVESFVFKDGSLTLDQTLLIHQGGAGDDALYGGNGNDSFYGAAGNDLLIDNHGGNDMLDGGTGADIMIGGTGNDLYIVDNIDDVITETSKLANEIDTVTSSVDFTLPKNVENLTLTGSVINGIGNSANNLIIGNAAANVFNGGLGDDSFQGGAGKDTYFINSLGDIVTELKGSGRDTVNSNITYTLPVNVENLVLLGTTAINGTGNGQRNKVIGNHGDNILKGGAGNDVLVGKAGKDTFVLSDLSKDTIKDFSVSDDTIQLDHSVLNTLTVGNLSATNFVLNTASDANDYLIYNSSTGALFYDTNGNGAGAATQIALLGKGLALTAADFVVI